MQNEQKTQAILLQSATGGCEEAAPAMLSHSPTSGCNTCNSALTTGNTKWPKRKRRHIPHSERSYEFVERRNRREKNRVNALNKAFESLRDHVPEPTMSKIDILKTAMDYISHLQAILREDGAPVNRPYDAHAGQSEQDVNSQTAFNTFGLLNLHNTYIYPDIGHCQTGISGGLFLEPEFCGVSRREATEQHPAGCYSTDYGHFPSAQVHEEISYLTEVWHSADREATENYPMSSPEQQGTVMFDFTSPCNSYQREMLLSSNL